MSKNHKYLKATPAATGSKRTIYILIAAIVVVILLIILMLVAMTRSDPAPTEPTQATEAPTAASTEAATAATEETVPAETGPQMLSHMKELYVQNPETIGYVRIDGTKLDYPVMWTPNEKWKYDHLSFEGNYSFGGVPYLNEDCSVDPATVNLIIYGHNMMDGSQFHTLIDYHKKSFWEEHPTIYFSTLYEEREYEILAAFYDQIYYDDQDVFKYYYFIDPQTEEEFDEGIAYFKHKSLYDTGVDAEWGDQLITLVTCSYHMDDGRFVLVGRLVEDEPAEGSTAPTE